MRKVKIRLLRKLALIAAIPLIVVGFLIWSALGLNGLMQNISGLPNSQSNSMELRDLTFRSLFGEDQAMTGNGVVYEWKMRIPSAYVINELGSNGAVSTPSFSENSGHFSYLATFLDPKTKQLLPAMTDGKINNGTYVGIDIENSRTSSMLKSENSCLRDVDYGPVIGTPSGFKCLVHDERCRIYTQFHGWNVLLIVPKDDALYKQPTTACSLVDKFLNQHTVSVN